MAKQIAKSKEALGLLKLLLSSDQEHRQQLASNLHAKKTTISAVALQLSLLQKALKSRKKIQEKSLEELRAILNELTEDLRPIHSGMSPPRVYLLGLTTPLRSFMHSIEDNFGIEVAMECPDLENAKMAKSAQAGVYRICTSIVEHMVQTGSIRIILNATVRRNVLEVSLFGYPPRKGGKQRIFLDKNLNLIQALLIWQEAVVNEITDWRNVFSFRFKMR